MKYVWQCDSWPRLTWDSERLLPILGRARLAQGDFLGRVKRLGFTLGNEAMVGILSEEAIKTSAIEGERLNPQTVRSSIARHLGLPEAGLGPVNRSVDGLIEVLLNATQNYSETLTAKRLKGWQAALFPTGYSGLHKIKVGHWRGDEPMRVVSGPIDREKVHYQAPPGDVVERMMRDFLLWWESSKIKTDGLIRAGVAHFYFVTIHPFEDGNGRIARALTDMALAQDEKLGIRYYSVSSQIMEEREDYYLALEKCSKSNNIDITNWLVWFLECYARAIKRADTTIGNVLAKADFWQQHAQTVLSERQRKVINRILAAGKGNFTGDLTTRKYASIAKVSRSTAFREIDDLLGKKVLRQLPGKGRSVHYDLIWPKSIGVQP